jgi:hypothetical protein
VAFVASDFETNKTPWDSEDHPGLQQSAWTSFKLLNNTECVTRYLNSQSGAGDVVVVTDL